MATTASYDGIRLPDPCLVVLVGPSGSGKSYWAAEWFAPEQVVSSDRLRALVGEHEHDRRAGTDAFAVLDMVLERRLRRRLLTVVDTLGMERERRRGYVALARRHDLPVYAVAFDAPAAECRARNQARDRPVPAKVLAAQLRQWPEVRDHLADDGFVAVTSPDPVQVVDPRYLDAPAAAQRQRDDPKPLEFGLQIANFSWPGGAAEIRPRLATIARTAEDVGFTSLWVMDHFMQIPQVGRHWDEMLDGWTTLGFLAGHTERATLGTLVSGVTYRNVAHLGKIAATLDVLSGGRAVCGIGAAWYEHEHKAYGFDFPPVRDRFRLLEDALRLLPLMWGPGSPSFEGAVLTVPEAICYPRPLQERIPILVGGSGERRTLRLVAKYADACNLFGTPDIVRHKVEVLHRHCADVGRDPATVRVTHLSVVGDVDTDDHIGYFRELAEAGVQTAMVRLRDGATPEQFAPVIKAFGVTLLADLVATSHVVATTSSRSAKVKALADLIARLEPDEVDVVVAMLSGEARQGRIGIGWATISALTGAPANHGVQATQAGAPTLAVVDVDSALDRLAVMTGPGSVAARAEVLGGLFDRATADEAEFLRRLLLGDLRQGALAGIMAEAVAKAAVVPAAAVRRAAMLAGDLCRVAALAMEGGADALAAVTLRPLSPVLPMLAASSPDVAHALAETGEASIDWKLDGARIQVHRAGDEVRIFTRNLNEITNRLPQIVALARSLPATTFILDGEALGWDEEGERPGRFQESMSSFGRHDPAPAGAVLASRFFDILHLDGDDLLDLPLRERMEALDRLAGSWRVPSIVTADPIEAATFFDAAVAAGHEGVMVKAVGSPYDAGRRGGAWRKVKPVQTFDLVVLAAEWGHGRRQGWLSNLHLGARGPSGELVMVGKTFKGLTDELLTWQTAELLAREERRSGITVHVRPELVVEIALDGVQSSTRYPGGLALRFAHVRGYRPDKTPAEADSIESLQALIPGAG